MLTLVVFLALAVSSAQANVYTRVLQAYEANGGVSPCQFTSQQLQTALKGIDTYGQQYFADFTAAVQGALAGRASGACVPKRERAAASTARSRTPLKLGSLTAPTGASLPVTMLVMAGIALLAVLVAALAAVWWWRGWDPRWARRVTHAWGGAGYRSDAAAAELEDWMRRS